MTLRSSLRDAARRAYLGVTRGTLVKADDGKKMQELTVKGLHGEQFQKVEHWHSYGMSMVPLPPKDGKQAELLIAYLGGSHSHPVVLGVADRRHRKKGMQEGEVALHDDQGQEVHHTRDGTVVKSPKKITLQCGSGSIVLTPDGKITLTGEIHLGGEGGQLVHRKGDVDSAGDTAVGSATKVFAV